jgi:hypothetical protein
MSGEADRDFFDAAGGFAMNADYVRSLMKAEPFITFRLFMSHGASYLVKHPENAFVMKTRMIVWYPETDDVAHISLLHVNDIKFGESAEVAR